MYEIEIMTKKSFANVRGEDLFSEIKGLGIKGITGSEYSALYKIEGINSSEAKKIASELLSDKITESYVVRKDSEESKSDASIIEVWYRKGVTDTVAESIVKAVKDLGIKNDVNVKTGHKYYIYGKMSKAMLEKIATGLLANTLIQEYKIK